MENNYVHIDPVLRAWITAQRCPYCDCATQLVPGDLIYPHKASEPKRPAYMERMYYQCIQNPDHYVGTYSNSTRSLGRLADKSLRRLKSRGHAIFDPLWRYMNQFSTSQEAYCWLSKKMKLDPDLTHFGMFSPAQCLQAMAICEEKYKESGLEFPTDYKSFSG